jgi:hypothetical protein
MAKFRWHAGKLRGTIGKEITYTSWRGIQIAKIYNPPSNPRTKKQVEVRTVFRETSLIAKQIYHNILKPYTFPAPRRHTAYNHMIKINRPMFVARTFDYSKLKIFEGPLMNNGFEIVLLDLIGTANEELVIGWPNSDAAPEDIAFIVIYDEATGSCIYGSESRSYGELLLPTGILRPADPALLHAYLVFVRPPNEATNEPGQVSDTAYSEVVTSRAAVAPQPADADPSAP